MTENPHGVKLTPRARIDHARATLALAARGRAIRGDDGIEVSIPNIIVAIVVSLVIIGSVIAGIVFVVPFAQNSTAKSDLQTVQSAQQIYYSQVAPPVYGTAAELVASGAIFKTGKKIAINANGNQWCAGVLSETGANFWLYSSTVDVVSSLPPATAAGSGLLNPCPTVAQIAASTGLK